MTIKELIEELKKFDENEKVFIESSGDEYNPRIPGRFSFEKWGGEEPKYSEKGLVIREGRE